MSSADLLHRTLNLIILRPYLEWQRMAKEMQKVRTVCSEIVVFSNQICKFVALLSQALLHFRMSSPA